MFFDWHSDCLGVGMTWIELDGSEGEGGGQILRSSLSLSLITGRPFRLRRIRAGRARPGLMRQHLACVEAAVAIGSAEVTGATLHSSELTFRPQRVSAGRYSFRVDSAGSALLVMQTLLLPLLRTGEASELLLEGGTHNPFAPPFPYIAETFLPLLRRLGLRVEAVLEQPGFYPAGGGRCGFWLEPNLPADRAPLHLSHDPAPPKITAQVLLAGIPRSVAERELRVIRSRLGLSEDQVSVEVLPECHGPGNTVHLRVERGGLTEVFSGFGAPRRPAEDVAREALDAAERFLAVPVVVGEHSADQLLLPLALGPGGTFETTEPSEHTRTQCRIIEQFLERRIHLEPVGPGQWRIRVPGEGDAS